MDAARAPQSAGPPLMSRQGPAGREVLALDVPPLPAGPLIAELVLLNGDHASVHVLGRLSRSSEHLVSCYKPGVGGRALVFAEEERTTRLRVKAKGTWALRIRGPQEAHPLTGATAGVHEEVLAHCGGPTTATIAYHGDPAEDGGTGAGSLLCVWFAPEGALRRKEADLLLIDDRVRSYDVELPGPGLMFVQCDGAWTVTPH